MWTLFTAVAGRLKLEPGAPERVTSPPSEALAAGAWPALAAEVSSAAGDALIVADLHEVMRALAGDGPRLGDRPEALNDLRVQIEARMPGVDVPLADLSLEDFRRIDPELDEVVLDEGVYDVLGVRNAVEAMVSHGSTAPEQVRRQIARWKRKLEAES